MRLLPRIVDWDSPSRTGPSNTYRRLGPDHVGPFIVAFVDIFRKGHTMSTMADRKAKRTRRSFTDDYKQGAVGLVLDEGRRVAGVARWPEIRVSPLNSFDVVRQPSRWPAGR